jgi:1L-myo-inositol 1-phosphate cytidylyltransferase / CDP-L-myo-inositol myo-inositolphosphotransferase
MAFALLLAPAGDGVPAPQEKLLGLTLPLRLALTAQASGATAIVTKSADTRKLLDDSRLRLPIVDARPSGTSLITAPENLLIHRGLLNEVVRARGGQDTHLVDDAIAFDPPYGFAPIAITDKATRRAGTKALLRSLRKPQDGWTSTFLNRYISLFFTRFLVATPFTPNTVSVGILAIGLAGAYFASLGVYTTTLLGAFLFQMQSILDGCDGEMSRLTFRGSVTGEWMDTIGDDLTNYGFFTAAAWGLFKATANPLYLVAGGTVLACGLISSGIEYRYLIKIGSGDLLKYPIGVGSAPGGSAEPTFLDKISPLFKRDTFVFLTLIAAALNILGLFLVLFALGAIGIVIAVFKAELRMARERRAEKDKLLV